MKNKFLLVVAIAALLVCVFAISVSAANVYYKDQGGTTLFTGVDENSDRIFESYEGEFPRVDEGGNALSWYIASTATEGDDTVHTVASFLTIDLSGEHAKLSDSGTYSYVSTDKELSLVSVYFPNDKGVTKLSLSDNGFGSAYSYGSDKSNLLFIRLPNTLTELPGRFAQSTPLIACEIDDDALISSFGATSFYEAKNLRSVNIPSNVTILYSNSHSNSGCTFYNCVSLVDVEFSPNSSLETIQINAFLMCSSLKEITVPNTVVNLGARAFHGCKSLETVRLGANAGKGLTEYDVQSMLYECASLKSVYFSDTMVPTKGSHMFYSGTNSTVFFYTGSFEQYEAFYNALKTLGNNGKFIGATPIEWDSTKDDQYYRDLASSEGKCYVVYGYGRCEAFYGGHKMSDDAQMQFESYFAPVKFGSVCTNEGCGHAGIDESKTIGAMFVDYGYSATEAAINGTYSMSQFYGINKDAIEQYRALTESFEYGFVVAANADPFGAVADGTLAENKLFVTEEKFFAYDYVSVSVGGISESNMDTAITFCLFVKDGDKLSYLDGGKTVDTVTMKSYNGIVAVAQ